MSTTVIVIMTIIYNNNNNYYWIVHYYNKNLIIMIVAMAVVDGHQTFQASPCTEARSKWRAPRRFVGRSAKTSQWPCDMTLSHSPEFHLNREHMVWQLKHIQKPTQICHAHGIFFRRNSMSQWSISHRIHVWYIC